MLIKSPKPPSIVRRPSTRMISTSVKPLRVEILGNFINGSDDGDSDEADDRPHKNHEYRLERGRQVFGERIDFIFIKLGDIEQRFTEVARHFSHGNHLGNDRREKFRMQFEM